MKAIFILFTLISISQALTITGQAKVNSEKVYTEIRKYNSTGALLYESIYKDSKDKIITTKRTHKSQPQWRPTFDIVDTRNNASLNVRVEGNLVKSTFIENKDTNHYIRKYKQDWIWDSGIHYWIAENWNQLSSIKKLTIYAPENDYVLPFKAIKEKDGKLERVTLTPQSWWLKVLLKEIKIWYNEQKEIVTYEGLSDIKDGDGDNYITTIDYK